MLKMKKMIALNIIAFAIIVCIAKYQASNAAVTVKEECAPSQAATSFRADDFSIINLLSITFR